MAAKSSKRAIIYDMQKNKKLSKVINTVAYQSSWSEPVLSSKARVLATFDVYYKNKQKPDETDFAVIAVGIKLLSSLL